MNTPLIYAVTLNWNRGEDTLACVESLSKSTYPNLKILVVDNGSTDGSPQMLRERMPQVEQLVNTENLGFARGINSGLRFALEAAAEYIFILNNDTCVAEDCLSRLAENIRAENALAAPLIYYASQPEVVWSAGAKMNRWNLEIVDKWIGKPDPGNWPASLEQDFITGCGILFSRRTLEQVGLFDEGFRMYYEDADLSLRMRRAGVSIQVIPAAKMWHKVAMSSGGRDTPNERYWMARSSIRYFRKHARGIQIPIILFWRTGSAILTTFRLLSANKRPALQAYWRGLRDGLSDPLVRST